MKNYQSVLPHGSIHEVLPDVFFVTGTMKNEFFGSMWQFSRNMTIVREDGKLTIFNSVRLNDDGLAELDKLGKVANVVRLGDMHGVDDPFYVDRYNATFWALPGMTIQSELKVDKELTETGELPLENSSIFIFKTAARPEAVLRINREGGIMIACDSLQNWVEPDEFFDEQTIKTMTGMNFFKSANLGVAWMHVCQPKSEDFIEFKKIPFKHAFTGHGFPLLNTAQGDYHATIKNIFNI